MMEQVVMVEAICAFALLMTAAGVVGILITLDSRLTAISNRLLDLENQFKFARDDARKASGHFRDEMRDANAHLERIRNKLQVTYHPGPK